MSFLIPLLALGTELFAAVNVPPQVSLAEAQRLLRTGRYEEALEAFEPLRAEYPAETALGEARCHRAVGRWQSAWDRLQAVVAAQPSDARLPAELARLAFDRGRYEEAARRVAEALQRDGKAVAATWWQAELDRVHGRLGEALAGYGRLVEFYNRERPTDFEQLRWIGLAAARQARLTANHDQLQMLVRDFYPACWKRDELCWEAHLEAARLLLEKYNRPGALTQLNAALAINPRAAEVHVARAELALQDLELAVADQALRRALAINPRQVDALLLRADWWLVGLRRERALESVRAAEAIHGADERTLGRLAALYGLRDGLPPAAGSPAADVIALAEAGNQHCGEFFAALAATLDLARRYPQAARYYEESRRRLPRLGGVTGRLGLVLLRLGDEAEAGRLLRESFREDPYNVRVKNSLTVLEILADYAVLETEHFILRFDRGQDELLARYAADYLEREVYPDLVERLGFRPVEKSLIEIFSRARNTSGHGWFSARMVGLPRIGTVAACAGKVVALASPNDLPEPYAWARALRHEFVHLLNLQQTNFNVPHWFTEGLAVLHEDRPPPPQWLRILVRRHRENRLFTLDDIDLGFLRPASQDDWALAYCQAELYVQFMQHDFGEQAPLRLLEALAENRDLDQALVACFDHTPARFEAAYREYVDRLVEGLEGGAESAEPFDRLLELADEHLRAGRFERAEQLYHQGRKQFPLQDDVWLKLLARLHLLAGNETALERILKLLVELDGDSTSIRKKLAQLAQDRRDFEASADAASEALWIDVRDAAAHGLLAAARMGQQRFDDAVREYRVAAELEPRESRWLRGLAEAYRQAGQEAEAREVLESLRDSTPVPQPADARRPFP